MMLPDVMNVVVLYGDDDNDGDDGVGYCLW